MTIQRWTSVIESRRGGHAAALPFDPKEVFGRVRTPVAVTVKDHNSFYTPLLSTVEWPTSASERHNWSRWNPKSGPGRSHDRTQSGMTVDKQNRWPAGQIITHRQIGSAECPLSLPGAYMRFRFARSRSSSCAPRWTGSARPLLPTSTADCRRPTHRSSGGVVIVVSVLASGIIEWHGRLSAIVLRSALARVDDPLVSTWAGSTTLAT